MNINTKNLVSITDANQNFSKVARLVDENGSVIILKNNVPGIWSWNSAPLNKSSLPSMKMSWLFPNVSSKRTAGLRGTCQMIRLSKPQILLLHEQLIAETGGSSGLRNEGILDSAQNAPFQTFGGKDVYPSLQQKAARLCFGMVKNHPFIDGNKRIGAHVMLVFLALNGIELQHTQTELSDVILQLAAGTIQSADLLNWILTHQI